MPDEPTDWRRQPVSVSNGLLTLILGLLALFAYLGTPILANHDDVRDSKAFQELTAKRLEKLESKYEQMNQALYDINMKLQKQGGDLEWMTAWVKAAGGKIH